MLPAIHFRLEMPQPISEASAFLRLHRKAVRQALTEELEKHHSRRLRKHYESSARGKYGHKARTARYTAIKSKVFHTGRDHVKTGRTRDRFLSQRQILIRGNAEGEFGALGQLILRFPFPASFDNSPNKVNLAQMADELSRFTPEEETEVAASFIARYTELINLGLAASPRLRKPITGI